MEFITENFVWFIIGGIVLLMTIIGFIAEKTDFGRKTFEKKDKPVKKNKKETNELQEEKSEDVVFESNEPSTLVEESESSVSLEQSNSLEIEQNPDVVIKEPTLEELSVPLEDVKIDFVEPIVIEEPETENLKNEQFVNVEPQDLSLPDLDTIENSTSVAEDDDIWKF